MLAGVRDIIKMKKIFLLMFCMVLLVGSVSAGELITFDNKLDYLNNDLKVTITNTFGIGKEIGTLELKSHSSVDEVLKFGFGKEEVVMYYDFTDWELYEDGLGEVIFIDMDTGEKIEKDYYFVEWKEDSNTWERLKNKDIENKRIGLKTYVAQGDYIDAVWTIAGKEIKKHAVWTADINTDISLYFPFDEVATTIDVVAGRNTSTTAANVTGKIKYAYQYAGAQTTGVAGYKPYIASIDAGSVNFWIKTVDTEFNAFQQDGPGNPSNIDTVIGGGGGAGSPYCAGGQFCITLGRVVTVTTAIGNMNNGAWHMITITVDGTTHRMYIDGVNRDNDTSALNIFGGNNGQNGFIMGDTSFVGTIDEFGVWDRALTNVEVTQLYNGGAGMTFLPLSMVILNSPINDFRTDGNTINFNGTISSYVPTNVSLIIDDVYNETNSSGIMGNYLFTKNLLGGAHTWTYEVCNSNFCVNQTPRIFTTFSSFTEGGIFFSNQSYETKEETFIINITTDDSAIATAEFFYNGISQGASTKTGTDPEVNFSNTIQVPTSTGEKEFYWEITVGSAEDSARTNQTINNLQLDICNASLTVPYINLSFKDEETTSFINATIDASTWEYWLGDGTYTRTFLYSNTTDNYNYTFCFSASNDTMKNTRSIQYAKTGYPQRKYDSSSDLTNATTNQTLYLLSNADGIYTTIQVVDQEGDKISGVEVTIERQFVGVWTVVGQEVTDDAGLVTFWVNPDYDHRFTFVSDDCTGTTVTIRPTQTQYTQQLQCGVSADIYVSQIEGIKYSRTPATGIIQAGTYNFSYQLVSSKDNIVNMSLQLVNSDGGAVLNSTWSTCNVGGCTIYMMHTVDLGNDIKGKYYLDVGNGSFLLEGDARWRVIDIPTAGKAGFGTFIRDMKYVIDEWGDDSDTADFNRLVIVFFFMCLAISALNYNFGNDTSNPGAFLIIMTFVILMGSIVGGTTGQGFFYFNNLTGANFINNYILLGFTLVITISYFINVNRQGGLR